jgi:N-acetylglucosamine-6-sulfatase
VHAPHASATPAPGDRRGFAELPPWRPSSYDEANVADKPAWVRKRRLDVENARRLDAFRLNQYRSLMAVDRGVGDLVHALRESGRLANTLIVFASDNGYMWGEHRLGGKSNPYEEAIRVPFVVRYDRLLDRARTDRSHLVLNLDVAPTFADAAGVQTPGTDGRSLLPLLAQPWAGWRNAFLIEHLSIGRHGAPTFCAVHTQRYVLVRYRTGEREMYDLRRDRLELRNVASRPRYRAARRRLLARLRSLCDPAPPGFSFG